jgi:adenosylcobinamide kinase/adenosylcobinamide-phosphate guanylyltransferase
MGESNADVNTTLILGGARSGKSAFAERLARDSGKEVVVIATATSNDAEMAARIDRHRADRPSTWRTVEEPLALADALMHWSNPDNIILVDCLTLWLSNLMFSDGASYPDVGAVALSPRFEQERAALLNGLGRCAGQVVLVSNEVGLGIVPMGAVSRSFVDEAGRLNQAVAAACTRVVFVAAGLPLHLKGGPC